MCKINNKNTMKYSKAQKLSNFDRPKHCVNCSRLMKPMAHIRIYNEGFTITRLAKLYQDECEWCGNKFEYWS